MQKPIVCLLPDYPLGPFPTRTEFKDSDIYENPY